MLPSEQLNPNVKQRIVEREKYAGKARINRLVQETKKKLAGRNLEIFEKMPKRTAIMVNTKGGKVFSPDSPRKRQLQSEQYKKLLQKATQFSTSKIGRPLVGIDINKIRPQVNIPELIQNLPSKTIPETTQGSGIITDLISQIPNIVNLASQVGRRSSSRGGSSLEGSGILTTLLSSGLAEDLVGAIPAAIGAATKIVKDHTSHFEPRPNRGRGRTVGGRAITRAANNLYSRPLKYPTSLKLKTRK